jgi:hypothetical protein
MLANTVRASSCACGKADLNVAHLHANMDQAYMTQEPPASLGAAPAYSTAGIAL